MNKISVLVAIVIAGVLAGVLTHGIPGAVGGAALSWVLYYFRIFSASSDDRTTSEWLVLIAPEVKHKDQWQHCIKSATAMLRHCLLIWIQREETTLCSRHLVPRRNCFGA